MVPATTRDPARGGVQTPPLLELVGISKAYPGVRALTGVDLTVVAGRGHALVGENGAGKSTLIKVMSGIVQPDAGDMLIAGTPTRLQTPAMARRTGISLVPQELSIFPERSVAENIFIGQLPNRAGAVDRRRLASQADTLLDRLGLQISPNSTLGSQRPAVQQMVMIARGIALNGRLFILDEPSAALTDPEIERLFTVLGDLKRSGAAVLYVSHRLSELQHVAEDITIMRDGRVVERAQTKDTTEDTLVRSMVGRTVERFFDTRSHGHKQGTVVLKAEGLTRTGVFEDIDLAVHAGEVVGVAGLMGAGRTEVARGVFGLDRLDAGSVSVDGVKRRIRSPRDAIKAGIALVPEERKAQGLVMDASVSDNIVLPHLGKLSRLGVLRERSLRTFSAAASDDVRVKAPSVATPVRTLSGGNQQKVVLARWLSFRPRVYILDEPTRGIDVGAKAEIYEQIGRLTDSGAAVLVISSELPELLGICDRIVVMRAGRVAGELSASNATEEAILELAMGTKTS